MPIGNGDSVSAASMGVDVFRRGDGDDVVKKNNSYGWRLAGHLGSIELERVTGY
ncbi:hypothetical protein HanRHA438_Chr07g0289721 [Helianthus annuus]|uniref:Uncharacterized protein n=1 Tax=Helianthus annuus TaxID=4232 RepID=A0A251SXS0_HELAN|nr:hypothetical protein HanXRQr2_Chr07g0279161 [Helianthus annuus]KAJ0549074.1 hypothetical protein HanHA300_Chr07g0229421 [Helianthus annuus]KAJ0562015.1 hypothetical protein HanHA89_Chr07g0246441 [Helianthus annuus]KAJ0906647.1 hypothetical protein HanRHA438_Chr07g0289721 [Helianthus annuus]